MKENKDKNEHNKYVRILNVKAVNLDWRISRVSRLQHAVIKDWKNIMVEGGGGMAIDTWKHSSRSVKLWVLSVIISVDPKIIKGWERVGGNSNKK